MSRVQYSKPSRRLAWAAAAVVLLALPTAAPASAQGFFFLFGGPSPYEIERQLAAAGYAAIYRAQSGGVARMTATRNPSRHSTCSNRCVTSWSPV